MIAVLPAVPLDIEALLAPIAGDDPAGADPASTPEHAALKEARREDADLPQGVWVTDLKRADWVEALRLADGLLRRCGKDAQVAAWLCEAQLGRYGVVGLAPGLEVLSGLLDRYGDRLHPRSEPGDADTPIGFVLEWLDKRLQVQLMTLPLTAPPRDREQGLTFSDLRNAQRLMTVAGRDTRPSRNDPPPVTLAVFNAATRATPAERYRQLYRDLLAASSALAGLKVQLDRVLGASAPSMSGLAQQLEEMGRWTYTVLRERGEEPGMEMGTEPTPTLEGTDDAVATTDADLQAGAPPLDHGGPIASRRDAYRQLAEIADFLARTEPHSPAPYLLHRIVQWRDVPLPALLAELSRGRKDVTAIFDLITTNEVNE